jgi:hypothetical protein
MRVYSVCFTPEKKLGYDNTGSASVCLKGDKGTQRHTAQDFETIEGTKNREPQSSSPNEYVP